MRKLVILSGSAKGQQCELTKGATSIGRADENNLVLEDESVSRRHALLTFDGAEYRLRDVGSRNGTRVNDKPILETKLVPNDVIELGEVAMRYEAVGLKIVTPPGAAGVDTERVKQLQAQIEQLTAQNRDLGAKISTAERQVVEAQKQAASRGVAELAKPDADLAKVRAELDEARQAATQLVALQQEKQTLATQLAETQKLAAEATVAKSQVQTLVLEKQQLQKQLAGASQQLTQERTQAAEREAVVRSELVATKQELTEANKLAGRVAELTAQNRVLETHLGDIKQQLTGAQKDLTTAWQDITVARQKIVMLERTGGDTTQAQAELAKLRAELATAKQAAERVEGLSQERQRLAAQLTGVEQQMIQAREQAQHEAAQAKQLQTELTRTREQIELAKKETAKIAIVPRTTVPVRRSPEVDRLKADLGVAQARWKEVSLELTKTKSELEHLRQAAPPAPLVTKPPAETRDDRPREREEKIAVMESGPPSKPEKPLLIPRPAVANPQPRLAEPPRKKMSVGLLAVLALVAVAVLGGVVWLYIRWSAPPPTAVTSEVQPPKIQPVVPPKVITEFPLQQPGSTPVGDGAADRSPSIVGP